MLRSASGRHNSTTLPLAAINEAPALAAALIACLAAASANETARQRVPEVTCAEAANSELIAANHCAAHAPMAQFGGSPSAGPLIVATVVETG